MAKQKPRRKAAARPARERHERQQDPRLAATLASAMDGEPLAPGHWIVAVSPVLMGDERELQWHPPQPVAFSLVEAKRLCDRAVPRRLAIIGNLERRPNDTYQPTNQHKALDVVADLWSAVLHSFAAIEAIANDSIDRLPPGTVVTIGKKGDTRDITQPEMVRRLNLDEKLSQTVPMLDIGKQIKGTRPWERYRHLKKLRDDLVHVKARGYDPSPDVRTAYDRLILGDGDTCAHDAFEIVEACRPGFLGAHVVEHLSRR
jgi:hypothetical protein